jgi:hypothetical protein
MYEAKKEQLIAAADSIELLILGNSSAMDGVDPSQFTPYAFNLAFVAQPYYFDIRLAEKYLPILPKLKYVVITNIFTSLYHEDSKSRAFFYKYYFDINYKNQKFWKESFLQSFFVYDKEQMRYVLLHSFIDRPKYELTKGWSSFHTTDYETVTSDAKGKLRADYFNKGAREYKGGDTVFKDLEAFIVFLQVRNIMPVLVTVPYYETLRKYLDKSVVEKNSKAYNYLAEKYDIDHLDLFADKDFGINDFRNFDHLNERGAAKLARKINAKIMENDKK